MMRGDGPRWMSKNVCLSVQCCCGCGGDVVDERGKWRGGGEGGKEGGIIRQARRCCSVPF
jgi:hypothetical protein